MRSKMWSIPAIALYFYISTILYEYGEISHFNIPSSFISASLSDNIVYFFQLLTASKYAAGQIGLLMWIGVIAVVLFILYLYKSNYFWETILGGLGVVVFFSILFWGSYGLGKFVASQATMFWTPSVDCTSLGEGRYIIPVTSNEQSVLIPIDENNKAKGRFLIKNLADLGCSIEYKNFGKIAP